MSVLVGYTSAPRGRDALKLGCIFARSFDAVVDIVMIVLRERASVVMPDASYDVLVEEQARAWMEEAIEGSTLTIRTHIRYADSAEEGLLEAVEEFDPTMLVISGSRRSALGRLTLGSVGYALMATCPVPLALAPRGMRELKVKALTRVTVGADNRPGNSDLVTYACSLAKRSEVPLRIVSWVAAKGPSEDETESRARKKAKEHIEYVRTRAESLLGSDYPIELEITVGDSIEDAATNTDWRESGLAVLGSSQLAQPRRLFMSSVASKIMRAIPVPLVVVPRDGAEPITELGGSREQ
ncbi:MAG: universal stress protein [Winkia neuii]|uniref:universal stress protein n=1 Tax=Winkia neuii TaxID=33007 RepID=UPI002903D40C|nr:universal stress protein [Winkia neuii]MDU3134823.1 universal stress protein [Winkia neuii]